jgi:hypothetical protein
MKPKGLRSPSTAFGREAEPEDSHLLFLMRLLVELSAAIEKDEADNEPTPECSKALSRQWG